MNYPAPAYQPRSHYQFSLSFYLRSLPPEHDRQLKLATPTKITVIIFNAPKITPKSTCLQSGDNTVRWDSVLDLHYFRTVDHVGAPTC